jgi:hypothetical protein
MAGFTQAAAQILRHGTEASAEMKIAAVKEADHCRDDRACPEGPGTGTGTPAMWIDAAEAVVARLEGRICAAALSMIAAGAEQ